MEQKYDYKQIPSGWRYCFNAQCPMKDQCLRFQTALALPDSRLTQYLGGNGTYYLYRNGKKWLTPRQQADIRAIFRRAGYKEEVVFGETRIDYDFT